MEPIEFLDRSSIKVLLTDVLLSFSYQCQQIFSRYINFAALVGLILYFDALVGLVFATVLFAIRLQKIHELRQTCRGS